MDCTNVGARRAVRTRTPPGRLLLKETGIVRLITIMQDGRWAVRLCRAGVDADALPVQIHLTPTGCHVPESRMASFYQAPGAT